MFGRLVTFLILLPLAAVLVALAVANRGPVLFTLDPFNPGSSLLSWNVPLFALLFLALIIGLVLGSLATWIAQGRHRRSAREAKAEAGRLLSETRSRDAAQKASQNLIAAS